MIAFILYLWRKLRKKKGPEQYERVFYVDSYHRVNETVLRRSTDGQLSVRANKLGEFELWYEVTEDGKVLNGWGIKWYRP